MAINRRSLFTGAATTAAAAASAPKASAAPRRRRDLDPDKPNILVVIVDEMRTPMWFPVRSELDRALPNIARIRSGAVSFEQHYTAANDCTPARGTLLTGLYSHQTGVMIVSQSTLSPLFPTWGTILREHGYETVYWGKWHLGHDGDHTPGALENYGFDGGTYPSPNGAPDQGQVADPGIADQFITWLDQDAGNKPWCTTVSFVNPHDIQYWPRWTARLTARENIPRWVTDLPPNYETPEQLSRKPRLQTALAQLSAVAFGTTGAHIGRDRQGWIDMRNLYLWLQQRVDIQIGRVLDALAAHPQVEANTVVVFTSDHGDYAGSHGLHGKGGAAYDESTRVPLYVHDPRGYLSPTNGTSMRSQLTSSVDIAPLLVSIATGGDGWRADPRYEHLANRLGIAGICSNPSAPGRPFIVHSTDEYSIEEAAMLFDRNAPGHVAAVRTATAKYARYSHWVNGQFLADPVREQEFELYDYTTPDGHLELDNLAGAPSPLRNSMSALLQQAITTELQQPLPPYLRKAQEEGWMDYYRSLNVADLFQKFAADAGSTPPQAWLDMIPG